MVRVREASESSTPVIDVDGSYLYRKQQQLSSAGIIFTTTPAPSPPITGWEFVTSENVSTMSTKIRCVTLVSCPRPYLSGIGSGNIAYIELFQRNLIIATSIRKASFSFALFAQTANSGRQKYHVIPRLP